MNKLRYLDQACIIQYNETSKATSHWKLTTVTKVEETKVLVNTIPIWLTKLQFGECIAQPTTFFMKQSNKMNRMIGKKFDISPEIVSSLAVVIRMLLFVVFYEKIMLSI